ncbi:peptidylprolyl isomerase [Magnetovibrio sp. PR-2]|uniref:peptidylprolyl isomerase n=1 Tax=Magnetovibrio sp. PR-2 TaxID=3120356 RepID=UPI002FCE4A3B
MIVCVGGLDEVRVKMYIRRIQIGELSNPFGLRTGLHFVFLLAFSVMFLTPQQSPAQGGLGIAAVVNDEAISVLDLNSRIALVLESTKIPNTAQARNKLALQVLRGLIDEKLKLQVAAKAGIKVTEASIEAAVAEIAGRNKISSDQLAQHLISIGSHISSLRTKLESQLVWNQYVLRKLSRSITIGDEEIKDEIQRIQNSAGKPEYLLAEIFLPVDAQSPDSEMRDLAQRLMLQLQQGASFSDLARNVSQAPSAALSGDLGWVQYANLDPDLQKIIPEIPPGRVSKPVRLPDGYYLIMVRKVRASPGLSTRDAMLKLSQYHVPVVKGTPPQQLQQIKAQLSATTRSMTTCQQMNDAGVRSGSLMSGSLGEMKFSTLPANFKTALSNLKPGQKTQPIETGGGWAVMMVCERVDEGANMEKVRKDIRLRLKRERIEVTAQRTLRDLRRDAFVDVRL